MLWHGWLPCFEVNSRLQKRILNSGGILGCALSHSTRSYMQEENRTLHQNPVWPPVDLASVQRRFYGQPPPRFCTNARTPRPDFTARISQKVIPTTRGGAPPGCAKPEARRAPPFSGGALRAAAEFQAPRGDGVGVKGPVRTANLQALTNSRCYLGNTWVNLRHSLQRSYSETSVLDCFEWNKGFPRSMKAWPPGVK